jgi:hypothetical protein
MQSPFTMLARLILASTSLSSTLIGSTASTVNFRWALAPLLHIHSTHGRAETPPLMYLSTSNGPCCWAFLPVSGYSCWNSVCREVYYATYAACYAPSLYALTYDTCFLWFTYGCSWSTILLYAYLHARGKSFRCRQINQ